MENAYIVLIDRNQALGYTKSGKMKDFNLILK